jgi:hypothetical protein
MLIPATMRGRAALLLATGGLTCSALAGPEARAQTTGPTIAATQYPYPERFDSTGKDLNTTGSRPQNFTPLGVNYQDCMDDQSLQFSVDVSGFTGGTDIQIWASKTGDCTQDTSRAASGGGIPSCWLLPGGASSVNQPSHFTYYFKIRVRDIVGPQNAPPNPPVTTHAGPEACYAQTSFTSQSFSIYIIPVQNTNQYVGTGYQYKLPVDLVGPPAPSGVTDQVGDTLFTLNWAANSDTDTNGYDVFMSPPPGQEGSAPADDAAAAPDSAPYCPEASAPVVDASGGDASADATSADAAADAVADATSGMTDALSSAPGCINRGGPTAATCGNPALQSSVVQDAGGTQVVTDDSGEGGTTVESGNGGISTIDGKYLVGATNGNPTVSDKSTGSYTKTNLVNGVTYTAVVAAVDLFGNVGPPSPEVCDYPAPVNDFWHDYKSDGGGASGFCALEEVGAPGQSLAGVALAVSLGALVRRRRRSAS